MGQGQDEKTLDASAPDPADRTLQREQGASSATGPAITEGRYEVVEELGRGGIGRVFLADDQRLERQVALKELLPGSGAHTQDRFLREARLTAGLEHPGIVPVYDLGQNPDGSPYYTMRRIRGRSLRQVLREAKALDQRLRLVRQFRDICEAVAYAHAHGVVHRDLKPDNVMLGEFGETVLLDWGLAKRRGVDDEPVSPQPQPLLPGGTDTQTVDGIAVGTPAYMSPEQAVGTVSAIDERSDVWGLGVILFEILTGTRPYESADDNPVTLLKRIAFGPARRVEELCPEAPAELRAIAARAMAKAPAARYQSAKEIADEVTAWLDGRPIRAYDYSTLESMRLFVRRHKAWTGAALAIVAAVSGATAFSLRSWRLEAAARQRAEEHDRQARRMLVRALQEKAQRALTERDHGAAAIFAAAAMREEEADIASADRESTERLAQLRSTWIEADERRRATWLGDVELAPRGASNLEDSRLEAVQFSPDGRQLAALMKGGHLAIIDDPVGVKSVREVEAVCPRAAGRIGRLSWSPDSRLVAAASRGDASCERTLEVLEAVSLKRVDIASIPAVTTATFSPDGRTLAVGTEREVRLLPMRPGGLSATMPVADSVQALAWSQDGLLAFSTDDGTVQLMHPDGTVVWKTRVTYYASSVAFLPGEDGVFIITVDGQWWKLSLTDGAVLFRSELTDWAPSMAAAQSLGAFLLGGSTGSAFLRAADGSVLEVIRFEESGPGYVSVSSDGTTLALAGRMAGSVGERRTSVSLFRIGAGSGGVGFTGHTSSIYHLTVAQDGLYSGSMDGTVRRWHADDASAGGEVVADLRDQSAVIDSIAVDRDAAHLAVVTIRGAVEVWDLKEKKRLRRLREGEATNRIDHGIAFSPDGGMLAVGLGKVLVRWSTADWSELPELRGHEGDIWRVAFSADGNWIATGATDATARLWPTQGGEPKVLRLVKDGTVSGVDFSPDSKELLACATDAKCQIFDVASGKVRVELAGHRLWVNLGVFSPDGKLILTGSDDQTARLWDRRTGRLLRILSAHEQVIAVAFSKDSRWVFFNDREVVRRVPAVPGPTDSAATLLDRAERAAGMRLEGLELVPIHR